MTPLTPGGVVDAVAVFPLPGVALFPGVTLPLHIFEPRYCTMTRDVLEGSSRLLVIAQIPDGATTDHDGRPSFCRVATIGAITRHDTRPDGRYDILVQGRARVALDELPQDRPYRRARATVIGTTSSGNCGAEARALRSLSDDFVRHVRTAHPSFDFSVSPNVAPGSLADRVGHHLVVDSAERQRILETLDDCARVRACLDALLRQVPSSASGRMN